MIDSTCWHRQVAAVLVSCNSDWLTLQGNTPLHHALEFPWQVDMSAVTMLIEGGANPHVKNIEVCPCAENVGMFGSSCLALNIHDVLCGKCRAGCLVSRILKWAQQRP